MQSQVFYFYTMLLFNRTSPTKLIAIMSDQNMTKAIYNEVSSHLQRWIPRAISFRRSSIYGIRVYTSDSILAPHVDRNPLISSAIINVDQNVSRSWPLEVYDHNGKAHNLTLEPGEMILYESHSVIHGEISKWWHINYLVFISYFCSMSFLRHAVS